MRKTISRPPISIPDDSVLVIGSCADTVSHNASIATTTMINAVRLFITDFVIVFLLHSSPIGTVNLGYGVLSRYLHHQRAL